MGTAPVFASVSEAMEMVRAGLAFVAAADAAELSAEEQAECLRSMERGLSESCARTLSTWTDKLPPDKRDEADKILADEAAAGMGLRDLAELAAEILARCRPDEPDEDPGQDFDDRSVKVQTTFQGAGIIHGDLTPECASIVGTVLDALAAPAGADLSDGRFELGIGTSGPQVIEGFHGVPFDAPIGRTREAIEICRQVWRREPLTYTGRQKKEAEAAVPEDLLVSTSLIGTEGHVRERLSALAESGVTTLTVRPMAPDHAGRLRLVERLRALADQL